MPGPRGGHAALGLSGPELGFPGTLWPSAHWGAVGRTAVWDGKVHEQKAKGTPAQREEEYSTITIVLLQ